MLSSTPNKAIIFISAAPVLFLTPHELVLNL
jgi:hypothetical protein